MKEYLNNIHKNNYKFFLSELLTVFNNISDQLTNNKEFFIYLVSIYGDFIIYTPANLKNDKDVVLTAINNNAWSLQFAYQDLRNDKDVVLTAVNVDGSSFEYASEHLQNDKNVVLIAISENINSFFYASEKIQNNIAFLRILRKNKSSVQHELLAEKLDLLNKLEIKIEEEWLNSNTPNNKITSKKNKKF